MNKSTVICAVAGGLTAIALSLAQTARADEASFIDAIDSDGLPVNSTTLTLGHEICADILGNGVDGVDHEIRIGLESGVSEKMLAHLVVDAVTQLCPSGTPAVRAWIAQQRKASA
jgi:hypothetical protein